MSELRQEELFSLNFDLAAAQRRAQDIHARLRSDHPAWQTSDFRLTIFTKTSLICATMVLSLGLLSSELLDPRWWERRHKLISATIPDSDDLRELIIAFFIFSRTGFTHLLFSQVETTLRGILRFLEPPLSKTPSGPFRIARNALFESHLKDPLGWAKERDFLRFFGLVRNLIHNNGLFVDDSQPEALLKYRGVEYKFEHGKATPVPAALLVYFAEDVLSLFESIVSHSVIKQIDHIVDPMISHPPWSIPTDRHASN